MESINPYADEVIKSNEQIAAEIRAELARLKEKERYLIDMLRHYDPEVEARERFIDEAYEGS